MRTRRLRTIVVAMMLVVPILSLAAWFSTGGRMYVVDTPSMGTWSPVGTLLWVTPAEPGSLKPGDVITFHPPTAPRETFTHRIVASFADGSVSTRGDINGLADPWRVRADDVVGRVAHRWWYVGWLVRALPMILVGAAVIWALVHWFTSRRLRIPAAIASTGALASLILVTIRPLFGAQIVSFTPTRQGARADLVGTGILPVRVVASDGSSLTARAGELGHVTIGGAASPRDFVLHVGSAWGLPGGWITALVAGVCVATILYMLSGTASEVSELVVMPRKSQSDALPTRMHNVPTDHEGYLERIAKLDDTLAQLGQRLNHLTTGLHTP